jgi:hypothetical protein
MADFCAITIIIPTEIPAIASIRRTVSFRIRNTAAARTRRINIFVPVTIAAYAAVCTYTEIIVSASNKRRVATSTRGILTSIAAVGAACT